MAFLLVLCVILTALQYRWTGEVSRAEAARLRAGLVEQAQALTRAFDAELSEACAALKPTRAELTESNRVAAWFIRYRDWRATNPRPLFRRIALAVPARGGVELFAPDESAGQAVPLEWPAEWAALREYTVGMLNGGPPNFNDRTGELLAFPILGSRPGPSGGASGWLLAQLNLDYVRDSWLPDLLQTHLSINGTLPYDVTVSAASTGHELFSSGRVGGSDQAALTVRFHQRGRPAEGSRGGRGGPPGPRGGNDGELWVMQVRTRPGALESIVSASRRRNLGVAVVVNGLILAAGVALVFHTRRSRQLAEQQMNFVATVSHELRTPLTVIRGAGHNLLRGVVKERGQIEEYSKLIIQHADQLKEMVEQVLVLSGTGKGQPSPPHQPLALANVLNEAIAAVADDTQAAGCEVQLDLPLTLPAATGDAAALRRVFQNLITNAAKHGGSGKWIGISAASVNGEGPAMVEVRVTDRGPGIPNEEQDEIFKPFFRGTAAQSAQIRGSGLGLSLVKEIVKSHGGNVSVHSESGHGATFTVQLPVTATTPPK